MNKNNWNYIFFLMILIVFSVLTGDSIKHHYILDAIECGLVMLSALGLLIYMEITS